MKKFLLCAIFLAIAISFLGFQSVQSLNQTVPVTVALSSQEQPAAPVELSAAAASSSIWVTPIAPGTLPTIPPIVKEQPLKAAPAVKRAEPIATVVAGAAVVKAPVRQAPARSAEQTQLDQFVQSVSGRAAEQVTGVYISGRFSLPVMQQPVGNTSFVSTDDGIATQFSSAGAYGTIGLLAHNYLSGKRFFELREGDDVSIVYGNGSQEQYEIVRIERYQALSPTSVYSDFIDVADPGQARLTADQVFQRMYTSEDRVVFQTCIEANGDPSWGRIFVIAEKVSP